MRAAAPASAATDADARNLRLVVMSTSLTDACYGSRPASGVLLDIRIHPKTLTVHLL
ncbi:hypothetical protein MARINON1_50596 [Marinobacter salarius]|nr:hypothetical protein MBHK15_131014 [Marinobacter salarius]VXB50553.1 hypothetical protein MARINON1_50596 [Marinobacter salarius]